MTWRFVTGNGGLVLLELHDLRLLLANLEKESVLTRKNVSYIL